MRHFICVAATVALLASANTVAAKATKPAFQLNGTSWTFVDPDSKVKARESIDAKGNYIENAASGKHLDHGTAVMKDGKACFTSAMNSNGEECWKVTPVRIGHSITVVSDKGQKLRVKRVAYARLSMPK